MATTKLQQRDQNPAGSDDAIDGPTNRCVDSLLFRCGRLGLQ